MISKKQIKHINSEILEISGCISSNKMLIDMLQSTELTGDNFEFVYNKENEAYTRINELLKYMHIIMQWDD